MRGVLLGAYAGDRNHGNVPFSHRLLCRLPSLPFNKASLLFKLSLLEGGLLGGSLAAASTSASVKVACFFFAAATSRGMDSGEPVPRAIGETLRDCKAEIVQASMSIEGFTPTGWKIWRPGVMGEVPVVSWWFGGVCSGGGGTAL